MPSKPKAIVFIDGANVFYTQKHLGWLIDWQKTKKYLKQHYQISQFRYYTAIKKGDKSMEKYLSRLQKIKIKTITKPLKTIKDSSGKTFFKANFDVEITADLLLSLKKYQTAIIFSGDSDFAYIIKIIQKKFCKTVVVYSSRSTISWEIKLAANSYVFFEDIINLIKKETPDLRRGSVNRKV